MTLTVKEIVDEHSAPDPESQRENTYRREGEAAGGESVVVRGQRAVEAAPSSVRRVRVCIG